MGGMANNKIDYSNRFTKSIRPQDDFFGYVNNKWLRANPIPPSEGRWGSFNVLHDEAVGHMNGIYEELQAKNGLRRGSVQQLARDFYYTGIQASSFEEVHLQDVNSWLEDIDSVKNSRELSSVIGKLQRVGACVPWVVYIDLDDKNSAQHIMRFHQDGLTLPDRDYYLENNKHMREVRAAYEAHVKKVHGFFPTSAGSADDLWHSVYNFEKQLAQVSRSRAALRDVENNYHKTTYQDLQHHYSNIDWPAYAKALGWKPNDKISIDQPEFLDFINEQFKDHALDAWKHYLKWQFLVAYYAKISEKYAELKFEFFGKVLGGTKELMPRWKRVVAVLDDAIGAATGQLYVKKYFPESSKQQVLQMVEDLRETYKERIEGLDWMAENTKKLAVEKLANIKVLIGYPDKWRDFSGLKIGRDSYIANCMSAEEFNTDYHLAKLHQPSTRDEWLMTPQTVNAYNDPNRLVICFPAAILQPPFFDPNAHAAINWGGIGSVIGHEFTHGFDDQGCQFDAKGNVRMWQTKADRKAFDERAQIIIDQADGFAVLPGVHMRGKLVIGESIADLGGVEIALHTLIKKVGGELDAVKLFFVAYATAECGTARDERKREQALSDPHPDHEFRVNGIMQHIEMFYTAYGLKEGDKLYRPHSARAKIW